MSGADCGRARDSGACIHVSSGRYRNRLRLDPGGVPPSFVSVGYQARSTSEFGDDIKLGGTDRTLQNVTVGLNDWACQSDYTLSGSTWTATGKPCVTTPLSTFSHPITLNIYRVDNSGPLPVPGPLVTTLTQNVDVPFRPSADPANCGEGASQWFNPDTDTCHNGLAFNVVFDFSTTVPVLPDEIIVAVAYNTQSYGAQPIGTAGPYNSLNVSLAKDAPTTGTDVDSAAMLQDSSNGSFYADGGAGGTGTFRADTGWGDYNGLVLAINAAAPAVAPSLASTGSTGPGPAGTGSGVLLLVLGAGMITIRRVRLHARISSVFSVASTGFEPVKLKTADLQSAPFGRLGNLPGRLRPHVITWPNALHKNTS